MSDKRIRVQWIMNPMFKGTVVGVEQGLTGRMYLQVVWDGEDRKPYANPIELHESI